MVNINLLPDVRSEDQKKKKTMKLVNTISIGAGLIFLLGAIAVFTIKGITLKNYRELKSDIATQETRIDEHLEAESALVAIKSHLGSVSGILSDRKQYSSFLTTFSNYVPQSIRVTDLTVSEDNLVVINGEAPSNEKLAGFVLVLQGRNEESASDEEIPEDHIYSDVTINSIARNEAEGNVRFSISFTAEDGAFISDEEVTGDE